MANKEFIAIWVIGVIIFFENIAIFKFAGKPLAAFLTSIAIILSLSILKNKDGKNMVRLIKDFIK